MKSTTVLRKVAILSSTLLLFSACKKEESEPTPDPAPPATLTVTDIDGNTYPAVRIGNQVWMAENLRTAHYRNGDPIPHLVDSADWAGAVAGGWCNYDNAPANDALYGKLYNWYATTDPRQICPEGWHVPTYTEWTTLMSYLGGAALAGGKLKSTSPQWDTPNIGATNETGFNALPGGIRLIDHFDLEAMAAYFWGMALDSGSDASAWTLIYPSAELQVTTIHPFMRNNGICLRCMRD